MGLSNGKIKDLDPPTISLRTRVFGKNIGIWKDVPLEFICGSPTRIVPNRTMYRVPYKITLFPEILSLTFTMAAGGTVLKFPVDFAQVPWVLGRVCSRWRTIARDVHTLWNRVSIDARDPQNGTILPSFLSAALPPNVPLYIAVSLEHYSSEIICLMIPYLHKAIKFHVAGPAYALQEVTNLPLSMPKLEDLALICDANDETSHSLILSNADHHGLFKHTTRLQRLTSHIGISCILLNSYIALGQLRHLDLSHLTRYKFADMIEVLEQCTSLESFFSPHESFCDYDKPLIKANAKVLPKLSALTVNCLAACSIPLPRNALKDLSISIGLQSKEDSEAVINLLHDSPDVEILVIDVPFFSTRLHHPKTVLFENLYKLSIIGRDSRLLEHFELPRLRELEIHQQLYVGIGNIRNFIQRSHCALHVLRLETPPGQLIRNLTFLDILRATPSLRDLYAPGMLFDTPLLQDMADGTLLPNITIPTIGVEIPSDFKAMLDVKIRRDGVIRFAHGHCRTRRVWWHDLDNELERVGVALSANFKLHYED